MLSHAHVRCVGAIGGKDDGGEGLSRWLCVRRMEADAVAVWVGARLVLL